MIEFKTIHEFLNQIEPIYSGLSKVSQDDYLQRGMPYFRGVSDKDHRLIPSAYRQNDVCHSPKQFRKYERNCLHNFMREARRYSSIPEDDIWNWTVLAQHHGVPTRLLDITRNPLVAMWFACLGQSDLDKDGAVYVISGDLQMQGLDKEVYKKTKHKDIVSGILNGDKKYESVRKPFVVEPYFLEERMASQRSAFLVWGFDQEPLNETDGVYFSKKNTSDDEETAPKIMVHKIIIPANTKESSLESLSILGIDERSIYPGLDGIGRYIKRTNDMEF